MEIKQYGPDNDCKFVTLKYFESNLYTAFNSIEISAIVNHLQ